MEKIGFGGGCHWCTEAVFQVLKGVTKVEQGWIVSKEEFGDYSEAVVVTFDRDQIDLHTLTSIHLHTHSCTSEHSMRKKYRSAVYSFSVSQQQEVLRSIKALQEEFDKRIITQVIPFVSFKENKEQYQNYYLKNAENQFCKTYINPKFTLLMQKFSKHFDNTLSSQAGYKS